MAGAKGTDVWDSNVSSEALREQLKEEFANMRRVLVQDFERVVSRLQVGGPGASDEQLSSSTRLLSPPEGVSTVSHTHGQKAGEEAFELGDVGVLGVESNPSSESSRVLDVDVEVLNVVGHAGCHGGQGTEEVMARQRSVSDHASVNKEVFNADLLQRSNCGAFDMTARLPLSDFAEEYRVEDYYKETGFAQRLARSDTFANVTLAFILANTIYVGVDADRNDAVDILEAHLFYQIADLVFCTFFTFDIVVRFASFKHKRDCLRDHWFRFDSFLTVIMVAETWVMPICTLAFGFVMRGLPTGPFRLLRLLRLARTASFASSMPELITLMKGLSVGARAVASSLLMAGLLVYVFAIFLLFLLRREKSVRKQFGSLSRCMWTLAMDGTLLDSPGVILTRLLDHQDPHTAAAVVIFSVFMLLSALTVMNMLIGVLCEVVSAVREHDREEHDRKVLKDTILVELKRIDENNNSMISQSEFEAAMHDELTRSSLEYLGVDAAYLREHYKMLYSRENEYSIESILQSCLLCRGERPVTVNHLIDIAGYNRWYIEQTLACTELRLQKAIRTALSER